jgi:hypothetical protein
LGALGLLAPSWCRLIGPVSSCTQKPAIIASHPARMPIPTIAIRNNPSVDDIDDVDAGDRQSSRLGRDRDYG